MLRPVSDLPKLKALAPRESYVAHDVREFARNPKYEVCLVEYAGKEPKNVSAALHNYLRHHPVEGVACTMREGRPYLYRTDGR